MDQFFPARRSFRHSWIFLAGFGFFTVVGVVLSLVTRQPETLWIVGVGSGLLALTLFQVLAPGYGYQVTSGALVLKATFQKLELPWEQVTGVVRLEEGPAAEYLRDRQLPVVAATRAYDLTAWWAAIRRNAPFLRFTSVSPTFESLSLGTENNIVRFRALTDGVFLLVETATRQGYLISPRDAEAMIALFVHRRVPLLQGPSQVEVPPAPESGTLSTGILRWVSVALFVPVLGFVVWTTWPRSPGTPSAVSQIALAPVVLPSDGWVDANAYQLRSNPPFPAPQEFSAAEQAAFLRDLGVKEAAWIFASQVLTAYAAEKGWNPEDLTWDATVQALRDWVSTVPATIVAEDLGTAGGFAVFQVEFRQKGLRQAAEALIEATHG